MKYLFKTNQIVQWLLSKSAMSPKKLQKMLYYEYSWLLVALNNTKKLNTELFPASFEAWTHGPVIRSVYEKYKPYGFHKIRKPNSINLNVVLKNNTNNKINIKLINFVISNMELIYKIYNKYNADDLEQATHHESPWRDARKGCRPLDISHNKLNKKLIYTCYLKEAGFES